MNDPRFRRRQGTRKRNERAATPQCIVGRNACRALFEHRGHDINKVSIVRDLTPDFDDLRKFCESKKKHFKVVTESELERIAGGKHHEGIAILAKPREHKHLEEVLASKPQSAVLLDGVGNPHNVGAIVRVCGFFGVTTLIVVQKEGETLSAAAIRIAEGATELVDVVFVDSAAACLTKLVKSGFTPVTTSPHVEKTLSDLPRLHRPVFVFGAEGPGLSEAIMELGTHEVAISGAGAIESLNVACSVSVVLHHYWNNRG